MFYIMKRVYSVLTIVIPVSQYRALCCEISRTADIASVRLRLPMSASTVGGEAWLASIPSRK